MLPDIGHHSSEYPHSVLGHNDSQGLSTHSHRPPRRESDHKTHRETDGICKSALREMGYSHERHDSKGDLSRDSKHTDHGDTAVGQPPPETSHHLFKHHHRPRHLEVREDLASHKYDHSLLVSEARCMSSEGVHGDGQHHSHLPHCSIHGLPGDGSSPAKHHQVLSPLRARPSGHVLKEADAKSPEDVSSGYGNSSLPGEHVLNRHSHQAVVLPLSERHHNHDSDHKNSDRHPRRHYSQQNRSHIMGELDNSEAFTGVSGRYGGTQDTCQTDTKNDSHIQVESQSATKNSGDERQGSGKGFAMVARQKGRLMCFTPIDSESKHRPLYEERQESPSRHGHCDEIIHTDDNSTKHEN